MSNFWFIVLLIICLLVFFGNFSLGFFLLNDITTTPDAPPNYNKIKFLSENKDRNMDFSAKNGNLQKTYYPDMHPLFFKKSPQEAYEFILKKAQSMPDWTIIYADDKALSIEAVAKTKLLRFSDDIVIEIRPEKEGSSVHMRSKSRLGKGDLGTNARRIKSFLSAVSDNDVLR